MIRRPTVELHAIINRERVFASPPPAPAGTSLREWFAGLAMGNPELMKDIEPSARIQESLRIADELIGALVTPRTPSKESMAAPTEEEMQRWDEAVAEANETKARQTRATVPGIKMKRTKTLMGVAIDPNAQASQLPPLPPPPPTIREKRSYQVGGSVGSIPPPKPMPGREPDAGRYQVVMNSTQRPSRNSKP